jgi:hypothetical protein
VIEGFSRGVMLYKVFWVFTRRRFLVRNKRFGTTFLSHLQGLKVNQEPGQCDRQVVPKRWFLTKKRRRVKTQNTLYRIHSAVTGCCAE